MGLSKVVGSFLYSFNSVPPRKALARHLYLPGVKTPTGASPFGLILGVTNMDEKRRNKTRAPSC